MSFARLVYYSAVIGGWSAFLAWLLGEMFLQGGTGSRFLLAGVGALVGAAIGSGLNLVAGSTNLHWKQLLPRLLPGIVAGGLGGMVGILVGDILYTLIGVPRALGWLVMGCGIGVVEGITDKSPQKLRNGLIGGGLGGLIGGVLFDPLSSMIQSGTGMTSRATAFVILGICIGLLIGLAQVILKQAWLTVLDGYRPGRQLILSQAVTYLGRGDHLALAFHGPNNNGLEREHVKITQVGNGVYQIADNGSNLGTSLNNNPIQTAVALNDGDTIRLGGNFIRFNNKKAGGAGSGPTPSGTTPTAQSTTRLNVPAPPPPPPRPTSNRATTPVASSTATTTSVPFQNTPVVRPPVQPPMQAPVQPPIQAPVNAPVVPSEVKPRSPIAPPPPPPRTLTTPPPPAPKPLAPPPPPPKPLGPSAGSPAPSRPIPPPPPPPPPKRKP